MSTDLNASFNQQYINISMKMKKRFMRKPNVSEATNEFIALAIQCEHSDQPAFAAQAYVGAAKCEATAGNFLGEAEHYMAAARQFMKAEKKLHSMKFYTFDRENLEAAIGCFMQASNKYPENSPIRTSILMEVAHHLVELDHKLEAASYYEQALERVTEGGTRKLIFIWNLHNLQIECGKFEEALDNANKLSESYAILPENILYEIQLDRVLLTLLLKPSEESKPESLKKLFTDLLKDNENDAIPFCLDLRLKLQSIIICCSTCCLQSLINIAADTKEYLNMRQSELLQQLISEKKLTHMSLI